jgi:amino acid transporter
MKNQKLQNRIWIALNLMGLVLLLTFFYLGKFNSWQSIFIIAEISFFVLFIVSLYLGFIKTKFWKLVHSKSKNLDEREINVVLNALKYAYSIFAIICLVIIYAFAVAEYHPIDVVLAGGLLYLAHILPAAVAGWNEKNISVDND